MIATSKDEANAIEEELMLLSIQDKFSYSIQERVVKVTSMAGYVKLSLFLLDSMLGISSNSISSTMSSKIYIPSYMAYTSVLNRLRKWKKIDTMRETLQKLSHACKITRKQEKLDIVALNTYLAAICDTMKMRNDGEKDVELMREAMDLLYPGVATEKYTLPDPDVMSFNTVLNAAAEMKNGTLVNEAIHLMKKQGIAPDIVTYNAMLKAAPTAGFKVSVVDEILETPDLVADRYTVEMAIMPLVEEGRIPDLLNLLHGFSSADQPEHAVQNAYSTFLLALIKVRIFIIITIIWIHPTLRS
jgi:pentatricopeptide repeat protein